MSASDLFSVEGLLVDVVTLSYHVVMNQRTDSALSVGVRDLKARASALLRRVRNGDTIVVTDRRRPVALLVPIREGSEDVLVNLAKTGRFAWGGGKPSGSRRRARIRGRGVAQAVIEDRR